MVFVFDECSVLFANGWNSKQFCLSQCEFSNVVLMCR